jgi:hypothetical protein
MIEDQRSCDSVGRNDTKYMVDGQVDILIEINASHLTPSTLDRVEFSHNLLRMIRGLLRLSHGVVTTPLDKTPAAMTKVI